MEKYLSRQEICGRRKKDEDILESVFRAACQNKIGNVNYNKYGKKDDSFKFHPVTDFFIDSIVLAVPVQQYNINKQGNYIHVGAMNSAIWSALKEVGLTRSKVKAITFQVLKNPTQTQRQSAPFRNRELEMASSAETIQYYNQV